LKILFWVRKMTLKSARKGREYIVQKIDISDAGLRSFLLTLGLYSGEKICVIRHLHGGCIVSIKNVRYCIDARLAESIII